MPGQFHLDYMGSGDLITVNDDDNTNESGYIAEWDRDDSDAEYQGTLIGHLDGNAFDGDWDGDGRGIADLIQWAYEQNQEVFGSDDDDSPVTINSSYIPKFGDSYGTATHTAENDITAVESFHLGNNVYIGGGMDHIDFVWDDTQLTATYVHSYDTSSQDTGTRAIAFSSDGTKFFRVGYIGSDVGEYSMSTAWDVSTASYTDALYVHSQTGSGAHGLAFNTDGTKMFVSSYGSGKEVNEYHLSTAWDVSTASYDSVLDVSGQENQPRDITFNTDGTKLFIVGNNGDAIDEWTLGTGFDISTASWDSVLSVSSYDNEPRGIEFNDDGTRMFMSGQQNDKIHDWTLSTAFDISTSTYNSAVSLPSFDNGNSSIFFKGDGSKLFVSGNNDDTIDEYTLSGGWDDVDKPFWAFNEDMDNGSTPTIGDDHYGVIGVDADGDGTLWETTDTFNLDKIKIVDDSEDFLTQDSDASGDYYFKITPVTYENSSWNVETDNTVTVTNTTDYNDYLDLSSNTDFDDINYALIETESALISEVIVSY